MTRFLQQIIIYKEQNGITWSKKFNVEVTDVADIAWKELSFWKKHLREGNKRPFESERRNCRIVWGDAEETGEGAHDEEEGKASSIFREISAVHDLFLSVPHLLKGTEFVYVTDFENYILDFY